MKHVSGPNCYFCNFPLESLKTSGSDDSFEYCERCSIEHDVQCYTTLDLQGNLLFAHIYVDKTEKIQFMHPHQFAGSGLITIGYQYHFRLHLQDNYTILSSSCEQSLYEEIVQLSGFPITPENAKAKLQTILTFS